MDTISILGFTAALFTTLCNIPQLVKIIRTRKTQDVSALTYCVLLAGLILWTIYGILKTDWPVIIANAISATIATTVLFLKLTSKKTLEKIHEKTQKD
ncbi:SemiSWEET family sugar transporter [Flavobacterium sp.]|uniref:SemiSWEET family sugar transporter n=1 Tax=Flavobacterium sp. TaxID=239 RepID=UPI0039E455CC